MERRQDPLELWVGSWSPEDITNQEAKRLATERTNQTSRLDPSEAPPETSRQ